MFGGINIQLERWSYSKRKMVRGYFDKYPNSTVYFRRIRDFYMVYMVDWDEGDPLIKKEDREIMQQLINKELGRLKAYEQRKSRKV
ncbi:hypothetical protein SAMN05192559_109108 [Halobacillus karajensis]|uniref:Uncharacterized protein n=1 Tax=Halobacillus karajensis TaxID=195088 RepID=A0A024P7I4_9BACI|nr:hypothetical protein [Halobacillus karajensis]CDQ18354.1 hypothetical protein BN982_00615 [Halobacillus karajensis]CDQ24708.1 hypothetical protein BN983_03003 [Halobacillus karajensis]CDQ29046.1 hypothetical protein BN981_03406 [Halobacillus karajensis]SEI06764.1 hypothetical protein SAMN05192559_109108 [Halobacillus karajensis]